MINSRNLEKRRLGFYGCGLVFGQAEHPFEFVRGAGSVPLEMVIGVNENVVGPESVEILRPVFDHFVTVAVNAVEFYEVAFTH